MTLKKSLLVYFFLGSAAFATYDHLRELQSSEVQNYMTSDGAYRLGSDTFFAWMDAPTWQIHFARQRDDQPMGEPRIISAPIEFARSPSISGDGTGILYLSFIGGGSPHPYFMRSEDKGEHWSPPMEITSDLSLQVNMAASGNRIYLVTPIQNPTTGNTNTNLFISVDAGSTWNLVRNDIFVNAFGQSIAIDSDGSAHLAIEDFDMMIWHFKISNGIHALNPTRVTASSSQGQKPTIKVNSSDVHIAWVDYSAGGFWDGGDIFYAKSPNGGLTWLPPTVLTTSHHVYPGTQDLDIDLSNAKKIHIAWEDCRRVPDPNNPRVAYPEKNLHPSKLFPGREVVRLSPGQDPPRSLNRRFDVYHIESNIQGDAWGSEQDLSSRDFPEDHMGGINLISEQNGRLKVFFTQNHQEEFWKLWRLQK